MDNKSNEAAKRPTGQFVIHEDFSASLDSRQVQEDQVKLQPSNTPAEGVAIPLVTSRFMNQQSCLAEHADILETEKNHSRRNSPTESSPAGVPLSATGNTTSRELPLEKPATDPHETAPFSLTNNEELSRLKLELEAAKNQIAKMDAELSLSKIVKHTVDQAFESPVYGIQRSELPANSMAGEIQGAMNQVPEATPTCGSSIRAVPALLTRSTNVVNTQEHRVNEWNHPSVSGYGSNINASEICSHNPMPTWVGQKPGYVDAGNRLPSCPQPQRHGTFRGENIVPSATPYAIGSSGTPWNSTFRSNTHVAPNRPGSSLSQYIAEIDYFPPGIANPIDCSPPTTPIRFSNPIVGPRGMQYQGHTITASQSPTSYGGGSGFLSNPWNSQPHLASNNPTFAPATEPMNYRKLLDRNMSCNWKYIVEKIVCSNDQQASIFLQQKLKIATAEQKHELIQAIIDQAYPLMVNRFGNFLVQRCFEHGNPEQVSAIAKVIQGNVLNLSMDAFGCHVIQKAFDAVPENYKASMVHELLRRIPETVIHRYACHVWQKLFELRWSDAPPQIMKYVNEALRGMWHEVALGETGSLVVQNIFENCLEEDKRPCVGEVLSNIDLVAHGQFGNWCIQHICEHGAPADKSRAIEHVLHFATEYSTDQYASKVVEKCLKVGGTDFLERYLDRVCEGRADRPRMPLIDIAGDQYGNYLVQYILMNATPQHREIVANHIRKHMVSLRGSKFGSRVAMACSNPALATRPGPPTGFGLPTGRFNANGISRAGSGAQFR